MAQKKKKLNPGLPTVKTEKELNDALIKGQEIVPQGPKNDGNTGVDAANYIHPPSLQPSVPILSSEKLAQSNVAAQSKTVGRHQGEIGANVGGALIGPGYFKGQKKGGQGATEGSATVSRGTQPFASGGAFASAVGGKLFDDPTEVEAIMEDQSEEKTVQWYGDVLEEQGKIETDRAAKGVDPETGGYSEKDITTSEKLHTEQNANIAKLIADFDADVTSRSRGADDKDAIFALADANPTPLNIRGYLYDPLSRTYTKDGTWDPQHMGNVTEDDQKLASDWNAFREKQLEAKRLQAAIRDKEIANPTVELGVIGENYDVTSTGYKTMMNDIVGGLDAVLAMEGGPDRIAAARAALTSENLPPLPPGITWDYETGDFNLDEQVGLPNEAVKEHMRLVRPVMWRIDALRQVIDVEEEFDEKLRQAKIERNDAQEAFAAAMASDEWDSMEEIDAKIKLRDVAVREAAEKRQNMSLMFELIGNPTTMAFAQHFGMLGSINKMLGTNITFGNIRSTNGNMMSTADFATFADSERSVSIAQWQAKTGGTQADWLRAFQSQLPGAGSSGEFTFS